MAPTTKDETGMSVGIKRYLAIIGAKAVGLTLTVGFIFSIVSGVMPMVKDFTGGDFKFPESKSGYSDKAPEPKADPVQEAVLKIQTEYTTSDPESYIVSQNGPSLPASAAAGNILLLAKNNAITTSEGLKSHSKTSPETIANAIGTEVWVKIVDESHVEVIGVNTGIRCDLDLAINEPTGCVIP